MTNSFIETQKELARDVIKKENHGLLSDVYIDTLITQVIQNTHIQYREYADKYELEEVRQAVEALNEGTLTHTGDN